MTPEQAQLTQLASAAAAAHLRGEPHERDMVLEGFLPDIAQAANGFTYLTIVATEALRLSGQVEQSRIIADLAQREDVIVPGAPVVWDAAVHLAETVRGGLQPHTGAQTIDVPTAINSTFSLAIAALLALGDATDRTAVRWAEVFALGAAGEASVKNGG